MEFADGFGENGPAQGFFLGQTLGFGEAASVADGAVLESDGVDHAVTVEEVVSCCGFVEGVCAVADVDAVNVLRDFSGDGEGV